MGSSGFGAELLIVAPVTPGLVGPLLTLTDEAIGRFIVGITVYQTMDTMGGFTLDMAPTAAAEGLVATHLQPGARVHIALQRDHVKRAVMVGTVEAVSASEHYSSDEPRRSIQVQGYVLTKLLQDHQWFVWRQQEIVDPSLADDVLAEPPSITVQTFLERAAFAGTLTQMQAAITATDGRPATLVKLAYETFVAGLNGNPPFIGVEFADGRALPDLIRFDRDAAQAQYYDQGARLVVEHLSSNFSQLSCWDVMRQWLEPDFMELFPRIVGADAASAHVRIIMRKPPFAGWIENAKVMGLSGRVGTGFDREFGRQTGTITSTPDVDPVEVLTTPGWSLDADTVTINGSRVIATPTLERSAHDVVTTYLVKPSGWPNQRGNTGQRMAQDLVAPVHDIDPGSPSYLGRFGVRTPMHVISAVLDYETKDYAQSCRARARLLREWHHTRPAEWRGHFELVGDPRLMPGIRLVDADMHREYYVTAVGHQVRFDQLRFVSTAQVTRGRTVSQ